MKVLVLGPNGQLGSDLFRAQKTIPNQITLIPLDRQELDVSKSENISKVLLDKDFDALINCTSYHKTDEIETHASEAFAVNAHSVRELSKVCHSKKARFFHISTDYVFSGESNIPYLETDSIGPVSAYGASKAVGERLAIFNHDETSILRVASLFGIAGSSGKGGNFVETMIRFGKEKGKLQVVNDITMSPTSTFDVAKMILSLLEKKAPPGIYHAVNSGQATWYEFAREIISQARVNADVIPVTSDQYPTIARRPSFSVLDNSKISSIIGPVRHWRDALSEYLKEKGHSS